MHTTQKPIELLQAQLALYGETQEQSESHGRTHELLSQLGDVGLYATQAPEYITYPRKSDKKAIEDGRVIVVEPAGTPLPLFDKTEYADFLNDPAKRQQSRNLADLRRTYSQLAPQITALNIHDISYEEAGNHPNVIGRGSNKAAFTFRAEVDGVEKDLVALVDHAPDKSHAQTKLFERAANLALVKGKPGFEQGVAWSNDPPVVVVEKAFGEGLDMLSSEQKAAIPTEHWEALLANVEAVNDLSISLDTMLGNFYYDSEKGFTVIDFRRCNPGKEASVRVANRQAIQALQEDSKPAVRKQ